jgi:hypothetical protein
VITKLSVTFSLLTAIAFAFNSRRASPLDAKKLRRIAYEIVAEDENVLRLSDIQVLRSLISKNFPNDPANQDLVSLALLVARNYECDLNPSADVVVANNGKIEFLMHINAN